MSMVLTDNANYTAIANAIREKNGLTDTYKPNEMADAIAAISGGGGDLPEEAFVLSGNCDNRFYNNGWNWFINEYGNKITSNGITTAEGMFQSNEIEEIPFDLHFDNTATDTSVRSMFTSSKVRKIGDIYNLRTKDMNSMFSGCFYLKELPKFINFDSEYLKTSTTIVFLGAMFSNCYSLRRIPEELLAALDSEKASYSNRYTYGLTSLYSIDEINGIYPTTATMTTNMFNISNTYRCKDITFLINDDGTPYIRNWKSQTISLAGSMGYAGIRLQIIDYCEYSGVDETAEMKDDASYQLYKDNPDAWASKEEYSRYNHTSAVRTINTLPDTSAYLATAGGTNTIKFRGKCGAKTDGGAINTLTEEEIAVAAAKGWTVSFS